MYKRGPPFGSCSLSQEASFSWTSNIDPVRKIGSSKWIELNMKDGNTSIGNARNRSDSGSNINASVSINIAYYATAGAEIALNTQASSSMYGTGSQYSYWTGYFIG